ncbi:hypothetical protein RDI58_007371 [Solanum bulbocastanum]|uniref:Uncharacterized protein n=1 Tax=Solanum bulbocastanum TaxID=147425 RepID=A0AAN8YM27_SOLBU
MLRFLTQLLSCFPIKMCFLLLLCGSITFACCFPSLSLIIRKSICYSLLCGRMMASSIIFPWLLTSLGLSVASFTLVDSSGCTSSFFSNREAKVLSALVLFSFLVLHFYDPPYYLLGLLH